MKRIPKYRVWAGKKFLYSYKGMGLAFSASRKDSDMEAFGCYDLQQCLEFGFILQQFTGLKDKNGREIFDGDIVVNKNIAFYWNPGKVAWDGYGWGVTNLKGSLVPIGLTDDFSKPAHKNDMTFANLEVIGNVFENPELLKT